MKILVLGSTGKTGYQVVKQLLEKDFQVKAMARRSDKFQDIQNDSNLEIVLESILDMDDKKMKDILLEVGAVVSCLGHNITLKGIFGKPHYLVTDAISKIVDNADASEMKKLILMSTTACLNGNSLETFSLGEKIVMSILRLLLPPQRDNEKALKFLEAKIAEPNSLEWVALRPDALIEEEQVSKYQIFDSPQRSPIFDAGKTSRINVAHFMKELIADGELWDAWKYKTPVIYNKE